MILQQIYSQNYLPNFIRIVEDITKAFWSLFFAGHSVEVNIQMVVLD